MYFSHRGKSLLSGPLRSMFFLFIIVLRSIVVLFLPDFFLGKRDFFYCDTLNFPNVLPKGSFVNLQLFLHYFLWSLPVSLVLHGRHYSSLKKVSFVLIFLTTVK